MANISIPNSLRRCRKLTGYKQKDVAYILGVRNASMISRWEKGLAIPRPENLFTLALIYHTSSDALYADYRLTLKEKIREKVKALNISL